VRVLAAIAFGQRYCTHPRAILVESELKAASISGACARNGHGLGRAGEKIFAGRVTTMKAITVTMEKSNETKGTYRFDSPDPDAPITSVYVRKAAFTGGSVPARILMTVTEAEG
jgi:hypothetical protein